MKVSHILEGSVRKAASRLRITAQLIDGATANMYGPSGMIAISATSSRFRTRSPRPSSRRSG
ncbi:MAG: hypothetical protein WDM81_04210 [Rhizomicrobium sp.]